jgi:NADH-ubiquinone oxidoreductase chain 3
MTSTTFFIIFIPILAILLLAVNLVLAPHNPYQEKDSVFECGFHSFLGQNRTQFSVSFFIFGLLFLLFDLEILLVYPYSVSSYTNDIYGLVVMMVFFVLLTLGFIFELGKNALTIESRQTSVKEGELSIPYAFISRLVSFISTHRVFTSSRIESERIAFGGVYSRMLTSSLPNLTKRAFTVLLLLVIPTVLFGIYPAAILDGVHYSVSTLLYALDFAVIKFDASRA